MTKSDLICRLAELNPHLYERDAERIANAVFHEIAVSLSRGDRVELRRFGTFSVRRRGERVGRNPRSGVAVQVAEKYFPFFRASKQMHKRLNSADVTTVA